MKNIVVMVLSLFIGLTLMGCGASKTSVTAVSEPTTEEVTTIEVPTPENQMDLAKARIAEEMRVFDVNAHHETLYAEIVNQSGSLSAEEVKAIIPDIVSDYMDQYFRNRVGEILAEYNDSYALSDVETIFESASSTSLYELIALYEWTFYQKNH